MPITRQQFIDLTGEEVCKECEGRSGSHSYGLAPQGNTLLTSYPLPFNLYGKR